MPKAEGLTPSFLRSVKPPAVGQVEYADGDGLRLRVSQAGTATWVLGCRDAQGKPRRFPLGSYPTLGLAQARLNARELRERVRKGHDPIKEAQQARERAAAPKPEIATLTTLLDSYEKDVGDRRRSWAEARRRIESVFASHLDIDTLTITEPALQLTVDAHPSRSSAGAAVRYIRPVLKWGAKRGLVARGTGRELSQPEGAQGKRSRQLSRDEIKAILGVLGDAGAYGQAMRWLFWTACRLNEACGMRWRDVDLTAGVWTVPETKQGTPHVVPLPGPALASLKSLLARDNKGKIIDPDPDALVFPSAGGGVLANWDRATKAIQKASKTEGWHRHDIRRTVASLMGSLGVVPHVVEAALGHALRTSADGSTLGRVAAIYNHSRYDKEHKAALAKLAAELARIEKGEVKADAGRGGGRRRD
jgi:integrase